MSPSEHFSEHEEPQPETSSSLQRPPNAPPAPPVTTQIGAGEEPDDAFRWVQSHLQDLSNRMLAHLFRLEQLAAFAAEDSTKDDVLSAQLEMFAVIKTKLQPLLKLAGQAEREEIDIGSPCTILLARFRHSMQNIAAMSSKEPLLPHNLVAYTEQPGVLDSVDSLQQFWKGIDAKENERLKKEGKPPRRQDGVTIITVNKKRNSA